MMGIDITSSVCYCKHMLQGNEREGWLFLIIIVACLAELTGFALGRLTAPRPEPVGMEPLGKGEGRLCGCRLRHPSQETLRYMWMDRPACVNCGVTVADILNERLRHCRCYEM